MAEGIRNGKNGKEAIAATAGVSKNAGEFDRSDQAEAPTESTARTPRLVPIRLAWQRAQ